MTSRNNFSPFYISHRFPLALYKYLLGYDFTLEDLTELHPTEVPFKLNSMSLLKGKSLEEIMEYDKDDLEDVFMLNFVMNITTLGHSGTIISLILWFVLEEVELKENGRNISVTQANKKEFVQV